MFGRMEMYVRGVVFLGERNFKDTGFLYTHSNEKVTLEIEM